MTTSEPRLIILLLAVIAGCASTPQPDAALGSPKSLLQTETSLELPRSASDEVIQKHGFQLSFDEEKHIPRWVAYRLTAENLRNPVCDRSEFNFKTDHDVPGSPPADTYVGYQRGHMIPASDARWSKETMADTFLMTNIAPQKGRLNNGSWKSAESIVRDWAYAIGEVYVITGPVLKEGCAERVGNNICVPHSFFKAVLDIKGRKAIGFILSNDETRQSLHESVMSIDQIERRTGLELFDALPDELEDQIEADADLDSWTIAGSSPGENAKQVSNVTACPRDTLLRPAHIGSCCRGHGGVAGPKKYRGCCGKDMRVRCNDGTVSPTCSCSGAEIAVTH